MNKLHVFKCAILALATAGIIGGCSKATPPPEEPAGVIDIVPGQQSLITPPASQPVAKQGPAERNI